MCNEKMFLESELAEYLFVCLLIYHYEPSLLCEIHYFTRSAHKELLKNSIFVSSIDLKFPKFK